MHFVWDEAKRLSNISKHGLDFADAQVIFQNEMIVFEDVRTGYGEPRMIGYGLLKALVVVVVHIESDSTIRIISMRGATHRESDIYYQRAGFR